MVDFATRIVGTDDWPMVRQLFEPKGLSEQCWCTYFRLTSKERAACGAASRPDILRNAIEHGDRVGVLGLVGDVPVGWIGVGPRLGFRRLERSRAARLLARDDPTRIWSIVCLYLQPEQRSKGHVTNLIERAVEWARAEQADLIEAYPEDDHASQDASDRSSFRGRVSTFEACGFSLVERRLKSRALVRRDLR